MMMIINANIFLISGKKQMEIIMLDIRSLVQTM